MAPSDTALEFSVLRKAAANYDQTRYLLWIPLSEQPSLQLIPLFGNIVVFVQNARFISRTNRLINIPGNEKLRVWSMAVLLLVFGVVPILGLVLTKHLQLCTSYLTTASRCLPTYGFKERLCPRSGRSLTFSATKARFPIEDASSPRHRLSMEVAQHVRTGSLYGEGDASSWMEQILRDSPTDPYRTSLSDTIRSVYSQTQASSALGIVDIPDCANAGDRTTEASSSMHTLASYVSEKRGKHHAIVQRKDIARHLGWDGLHGGAKANSDVAVARAFRFLKRPEYLQKSSRKQANLVIHVPKATHMPGCGVCIVAQ
ncbi:hypothetical protein GQ54DRAFT_295631 [Martensiomyces pterosporus]|nr:hypothetical protein GQ54DRAFT_295631 [Martensiomyces pterosporus]